MSTLTLANTAIVLDSTCDPPDGFFDRDGLFLVPLKVHFGDEMFRDGVDMTYREFFTKLEASDVLPTTSQPTAAEFTAVYQQARERYEHVFSLHISAEMSGTVRAAEQAAEAFDNVYVYDLRTVTSALSLGAERLRARLERGCTLEEAKAYVEKFAGESHGLGDRGGFVEAGDDNAEFEVRVRGFHRVGSSRLKPAGRTRPSGP